MMKTIVGICTLIAALVIPAELAWAGISGWAPSDAVVLLMAVFTIVCGWPTFRRLR